MNMEGLLVAKSLSRVLVEDLFQQACIHPVMCATHVPPVTWEYANRNAIQTVLFKDLQNPPFQKMVRT